MPLFSLNRLPAGRPAGVIYWKEAAFAAVLALISLTGCGGGSRKNIATAPTTQLAQSPSPSPAQTLSPSLNTPATGAQPATDLAQAGARVVDDPVYGRVVAGQVLLSVPQGSRTAQDTDRTAQELGLSVVETLDAVGVQVWVDSHEDLPSVIIQRLAKSGLKAGPNVVLKLSGAYNDPALMATGNNDRWALERMQAWPLMREAGFDQMGVTVALLDTGVQADHPELNGQVLAGPNFIDSGSSLSDAHGHGTALAGVIAGLADNNKGAAGVCAGCKVQSIKVCNGQGECPAGAVIAGLAHVASEKKARVVNLSVNVSPKEDITRELLENVTTLLATQGVMVVASAGNDGADAASVLPNGLKGVFSVGATSPNDTRLADSNFGTALDLYAPGEGVLAPDRSEGFLYVKGTSVASALVAGGAAALLAERPSLTPDQLGAAFQLTASPVAGQARGRLNLQLARNTFADLNIPPALTLNLNGPVSEAGTVTAEVTVRDNDSDTVNVLIGHGLKGEVPTSETRTLNPGQKEATFTVTVKAPQNGTVVLTVSATDENGALTTQSAERTFETLVLSELVLEASGAVVPVGSNAVFTVKAKTSDGAVKDVTHLAQFAFDPAASLMALPGGAPGAYMALVMGPVKVKASYGGLSREMEMTIAGANTGDAFHVSAGDTGTFTAPTEWEEYLRDSQNSNDGSTSLGRAAMTPPLVAKWTYAVGSEGVAAPVMTQAGSVFFGNVNNQFFKVNTATGADQAGPTAESSTPGANAIITSLGRLHFGFPLDVIERVYDLSFNPIGASPNGPDMDDWFNRDANGDTNPDNIQGPIGIASIGNGAHIFFGAGTAGKKYVASIDTSVTPGTVRWKCDVAGQVFSVPMFYNNGSENVLIVGVAISNEKYVMAVDTDGQSDGDANSAFEAGTAAATLESLSESSGCDVVWTYPLGKDETNAPVADPPGGTTDLNAGSMGAQGIIRGGRLYFGVTAKNNTHRGQVFAIDPNDGNTTGTLNPAFDSVHSNAVWRASGLNGCVFSTPVAANVDGSEMLFAGTGTSSAVNGSFCATDVGQTLYALNAATGATVWSYLNGLNTNAPANRSNYFHAPLKYTTGAVAPGVADTSGILWAHTKSNLLAFDANPADGTDHGAADFGGTASDLVWRYLATANESQGLAVPAFRNGVMVTNLANNAYGFASPIKPPVLTGAPGVNCTTNAVTLTWSTPLLNLDGTAATDLAGFNVYRGNGATASAASTAGFTRVADTGTLGPAATTFTDNTTVAGTTYYYVVTSVDTAGNDTVFWQYSGPLSGYSAAPNRNQYDSRIFRDATAAAGTTTNLRISESVALFSTGSAVAFGSLADGETSVTPDCQRPAKPSGFGVSMQCPMLVFDWTSPTQDDALVVDGVGDTALTGLIGHNVYSSSAAIGAVDPYVDANLSILTPLNGVSTTNLIAQVGAPGSAQTWSINPLINIAAANYVVTAHDNAVPASDQNESYSSAQVNFAYTCQPASSLSASFIFSQCGTNNPIRLTWNDVDNDGTYRVYRKTGTSTPYPVTGVDVPITTTPNAGGGGTITLDVNYSLTDGAQEFYYVTSWDSGAQETTPVLLNSTAVVPDCNPPDAPANLSASDITNDEGIGGLPAGVVSLSWDVVAQDAASGSGGPYDVTEYHILRSLTLGGPYSQIASVSAGATSYNDTLADLAPGSQYESGPYYYIVRSYDGVNESADSSEANATVVDNDAPNSVTTAGSVLVCGAPAVATVTWTAPTLNDDGEALPDLAGFNIYRGVNDPTFASASLVLSVSAATTTYSDSTTTSGNTYYFFIEAYDDRAAGAGGPNLAAVVAGSTTNVANNCIPDPPVNVSASNVTPDEGGAIDVTWDQSPSDDGSFAALQYEVYRRTVPGAYGAAIATIPATQAASYTFSDTLLLETTVYEYKVLAVDGAFSSLDSNTSQAQPFDEAAPATPTLQTVTLNCPDADVTWARPSLNSLGAPLTDLAGYTVYRSTDGISYSVLATVTDTVSDPVTYTDDPSAAYPAEGATYYYKVVAFDDAAPPAANDNASSQSNALSVVKTCTEQPPTPTATQVCNTLPTPNDMTISFTSGANALGAPITTFTIQVASSAGGPFSNTTPATVAYAGPSTLHSVNVNYPSPDGTYYYRIVTNVDYGGGVTLDSAPSGAASVAVSCYSFSPENPPPGPPPDCGYSGSPWFAQTNATLMAKPTDVTVAYDATAGAMQAYANDPTKRLVYVFNDTCLTTGVPSKFGIINNLEGQTGNFTGTYGMARTNFSNFTPGGAAETLIVTRNYGTSGYLYKCTTAGVCTLDLTSSGKNIYGVGLETGPTHNFMYLAMKNQVAKYAYAGTTTRTAVATRAATSPMGIDTDGAGKVYYSDTVADTIYVLDANLAPTGIVSFGGSGTALGKLDEPYGIHMMKTKDRLFVAERLNNRVQLWDTTTGTPISSFGTAGQCAPNGGACAGGIMYQPQGIHIVEDTTARFEYVLVADSGNHRTLYYVPPASGF